MSFPSKARTGRTTSGWPVVFKGLGKLKPEGHWEYWIFFRVGGGWGWGGGIKNKGTRGAGMLIFSICRRSGEKALISPRGVSEGLGRRRE